MPLLVILGAAAAGAVGAWIFSDRVQDAAREVKRATQTATGTVAVAAGVGLLVFALSRRR